MEVVDIDEFMISMLSFMHEDENVSDFEAETGFVQSMCSDPEKSIYEKSKISDPVEVTWCSSSGSICSTKEYSSSINPSPPQQITSYEVNFSSFSECSFLMETEPGPRAASTPTMPRKEALSLNKLWRILEGLERSQTRQEESVQQQEHPVSRSYDLEESTSSLPQIYCKFCYKNGEPVKVYSSHYVKKPDGIVICPILRKYVCDLCGATGDQAHTRRYCRLNNKPDFSLPAFRRLSDGSFTSHYYHK